MTTNEKKYKKSGEKGTSDNLPSIKRVSSQAHGYAQLAGDIAHLLETARRISARAVNSIMTAALKSALETARKRFSEKWGITSSATIRALACYSRESAGLQAADHFLWALQRFYERGEERYLEYVWPSFRLVREIDATRRYKYGEYYTQKKPLTLAARKN